MNIIGVVSAPSDAVSPIHQILQFAVGLIGGVGATFLGFWLNQYYQNEKEKIKELKEYIVALQSTGNELDFYNRKLIQLSGELEGLSAQLSSGKFSWIIPTYSVYPEFLERCKTAINTFYKNPHLVYEIGHCHFELCHILARLDLLKQEMREPLASEQNALIRQLKIYLANIKGFKDLVDSNIPIFKVTREKLIAEAVNINTEIRILKEHSLFPNSD